MQLAEETVGLSYDCTVYKIPTPSGTLWLNIIEDDNGNATSMRIEIGKAGTEIRVWTEVTMLLINSFLSKGGTLSELIEMLSGMATSRIAYTHGMVPIKSAPEGLVYGIIRYLQDKFTEKHGDLLQFPRIRPRT